MKTAIMFLMFSFVWIAEASAAPVADPDAHCVLCDGDPGNGDGGWGGGGILSITENWLDLNYPGWSFQSSVSCDQTDDGTECYTILGWGGEWITPGCTLMGDGTYFCG